MKLRHHALDEGDGLAVVFEDALLGLGVYGAQRLSSRLPPGHEMIGREHVQKELARVAVQFTKHLGGEFAVRGAQRRDPGLEREWSPVDEMRGEGYEFFSLAWADFGLLTS